MECSYPLSLFSRELIAQAVEDYRDICRVSVTVCGASVTCVFRESAADLELTAREFSNYLIELAVARGGRS